MADQEQEDVTDLGLIECRNCDSTEFKLVDDWPDDIPIRCARCDEFLATITDASPIEL